MSNLPERLKKFGRTIRDRRIERGLTQQQVADWVGLKASTINGVEYGRHALALDKALTLIERLGITFEEIDAIPVSVAEERTETIPRQDRRWANDPENAAYIRVVREGKELGISAEQVRKLIQAAAYAPSKK